MGSPDREGGRGLQLCAALAGHWGVDYTPHPQDRLVPARPSPSARSAPAPPGPALPAHLLPLADTRVRVAVVQIDRSGSITAWNEDAEELFGYSAEQVTGKPLTDLAAWPHTPGHRHRHRRGAPALALGGLLRHPWAPTAGSSRCTPPTCASATPTASRQRSASW
ncbi:hypothetical protein GCM10019016_039550 [Streptomyces prasinosporus]|uniref:PAS domain-containing protein n=1 Tax=Streptomyces prasinosporus TaxID=68256 RepID=A0ABP6TQ05_9ACTN